MADQEERGATYTCPDHPGLGSTTDKGLACRSLACDKKMTKKQ